MSREAVIIGAGISGLLTAYRLLKAGWTVTITEAKHIGSGSSSRTAAGIRQQFSTTETVLGMRYSVDFYSHFCDHIGGVIKPIVQNGYLFLFDENVDAAIARVEMQKTAGLKEVVFLNPEETVRQFPFVNPESIQGATFCETDGFLRPGIIYGETAIKVQDLGARILQNAPVMKARLRNGLIDQIRAGDQWVGGDLFIDCTNAWSPRLAALLGGVALPISPLKRYLWFIDRGGSMSPEELGEMPMVITPSGAYCRPENRHSLMAGWAHRADAEPSFDHDDQDVIDEDFFHDSGIDSRAYDAWEAIAEVLPPIGEFDGVSATTSGYYGTTPDHNPFLGYDTYRSNLLHLVGFSGHGAMFGPFTSLVGLQLAEAGKDLNSVSVMGESVSMEAFALNRPFQHAEHMVI